MFDPNTFIFQGVSLLAMVFGLVEFIKDMFNLSGKWVTALSAGMGGLMMALYQLADVIPEPYGVIFEVVYLSLAFGLAASGYYKFLNARAPRQE